MIALITASRVTSRLVGLMCDWWRSFGRRVDPLDGSSAIVGYGKLKECVRLLFWSGQSFAEEGFRKEGSFKAAEARYTAVDQVDTAKLGRWLAEARDVQWDYENLIRRKGRLERLQ